MPARENRLEVFRRLIRALDGGKPADASSYVEPRHALAERVAVRLLLQPGSQVAVLGGAGSGKTTQMLAASRRLATDADYYPVYVDLGVLHDLSELRAGTILAGIALSQIQSLPKDGSPEVKKAVQRFRQWANGYETLPVDLEPDDHPDTVWVPGLLRPPEKPFYGNLRRMVDMLRVITSAAGGGRKNAVFLLDSLDRLAVEDFATACDQDLEALSEIGGVVVSAPFRLLFGTNRHLLERFAEFLHLPAADPSRPDDLEFLCQILRARADPSVFPHEVIRRLAIDSGGALRDLVTLARAAVEQAYLRGGAAVSQADAESAAEAFGHKHLLGLTQDEIDRLTTVAGTGRLSSLTDVDLGLLASRRILEYVNGHLRYAVHPTVRPLLAPLKTA